MFKRRSISFLCALLFIFSNVCFTAGAVDTLDDMDIDPYGDLQQLQQIGTAQPSGSAEVADQVANEEGDGGISVTSIYPGADVFDVSSSGSWNIYYYTTGNGSASSPVKVSRNGTLSFSWTNISRSGLLSGYQVGGPGNSASNSYSLTYDNGAAQHLACRLVNSSADNYIDVIQSISLGTDLYSSFVLTGELSLGIKSTFQRSQYSYSPSGVLGNASWFYPTMVQILVNGKPFGPIFHNVKNGVFSFSSDLVDFSSLAGKAITSVGYRFYFGSQNTKFTSITLTSDYYYLFTKSYLVFDDSRLDVSYRKDVPSGGGSSSGTTEEGAQERHEETKGLLNTIISWLKSIVTGITELPGKIVSALMDGLKTLFIPSEEDLQGFKDKYQTLLSERLGFIWQAGEWITSFGSEFLTSISGGSAAELVFPGVSFPMNGEIIELIPETPIDFTNNGIVKVVQPFLGTLVALVVVGACVNLFHGMVTAFVSGKSYFDFLKGGGDV